jgi:hypothetical protein
MNQHAQILNSYKLELDSCNKATQSHYRIGIQIPELFTSKRGNKRLLLNDQY